MSKYSMHLLVCGGTGCKSHESNILAEKLKKEFSQQGLDETVQVIMTGCFGFCEEGPILKVMPDNTFYTLVKPEDAEIIVEEHVVKGRRVERLLYADPDIKGNLKDPKHMGLHKKQLRIALCKGCRKGAE
jgi:(2Fe-2S) ferredoxin